MFRTFADMCDAGDVDLGAIGAEQLAFWSAAVASAEAALAASPSTRVAHVAYDDLVGDPAAALARVYGDLGLDAPPDLAEAVAADLAARSPRRAAAAKRLRAYHAYSLAEYGVAEADVDGAFAAYYAAHLPGARA